MAELEPNHYALTGHGPLQVVYASTGLAGQPQLTYQDLQLSLQFSGGDIRRVESDVGTLVSVTIIKTVDTGSTSFSVLIPRVTLQNGQPAHIRTAGVTTLHRLTVDTPAHGQLDTYQLHYLSGTASVVEF
jgi:hypothetical protein